MKPAAAPIIRYDEKRADDAYRAHRAMVLREILNPELRENPAWAVLRQAAYENFELAFEGRL